VLSDRWRRLARAIGFVHRHCSGGLDTQTALALVSAEARHLTLALVSAEARHLTLASVARNIDDPHVVFVAVNESTPILDDHLRAAWRRDDKSLALRRCWMNCSPSTTQRRSEVKKSHNSGVILECNVLSARLDPRCRRLLAIAHTVWSHPPHFHLEGSQPDRRGTDPGD